MANTLEGKRVAFLFTEGVEQVELTEPLEAARQAGADADLISLERGEVQMFRHPAFCAKLVEEIAEGRHEQHAGASARS